MVSSYGIWSLLFCILAAAHFNQASAGSSEPLMVESLYKETQEYFLKISKLVKDKGYVSDELEKDKSVTILKSYLQLASDNIVTILKNLEKDTAPYQGDIRKNLIDLQTQATDLSKTVRKTEIYASLEKLHDGYLESLRKMSDKICDFVKITALKSMVPTPVQSGAEQIYIQIIQISRTIQETVTGKKQ